jgi:hypothetical protein
MLSIFSVHRLRALQALALPVQKVQVCHQMHVICCKCTAVQYCLLAEPPAAFKSSAHAAAHLPPTDTQKVLVPPTYCSHSTRLICRTSPSRAPPFPPASHQSRLFRSVAAGPCTTPMTGCDSNTMHMLAQSEAADVIYDHACNCQLAARTCTMRPLQS